MSMHLIYKDFMMFYFMFNLYFIMPLRMHFSSNNFEELKWKFINMLLWGDIYKQVTINIIYVVLNCTENQKSHFQ